MIYASWPCASLHLRPPSADLQIERLKAAGCEQIFTETGSGARADPPGLQKAIACLREGQDQLVVWRFDRLARSLLQLIETANELHERKIGFRSLTENIDTSSSCGELLFHIFSSIAEFERDLIRERTLGGLESAGKKGRRGGRPKALDAAGVVEAQALLKKGDLTAKDITARLGVSVPTLYRYVPASTLKEDDR